jgi:hypothetical protein
MLFSFLLWSAVEFGLFGFFYQWTHEAFERSYLLKVVLVKISSKEDFILSLEMQVCSSVQS